MLNPSFFKITQKMNENPVYWNIKSFLFEEFKLNSTQNSKSEETFLKSLRKTDAEKKLIALIKEVSTLNKNFMTSYLSDDPIANVNEYKKKCFCTKSKNNIYDIHLLHYLYILLACALTIHYFLSLRLFHSLPVFLSSNILFANFANIQ